jgi:hypothetical protein
MIGAKKGGEKTSPATPSFRERNYCEEDHHEAKTFWGRIENNKLATDNQ